MTQTEPILIENKDRFVLFPIKHKEIWQQYKSVEHIFWFVEGLSFDGDIRDFKTKLTDYDKKFLRFIITTLEMRFANHTNNITPRFLNEVQYPEARCFYGFQTMQSDIHCEVYQLLTATYIGETIREKPVYNEISESNSFKLKSEWVKTNFHDEPDFAKRMVASVIIQRVFYSSTFASILSYRQKNLMEVMCMLTSFIYQDEGLFTDFSLSVYSQLTNKLPIEQVKRMIDEALEIENQATHDFMMYHKSIRLNTQKLFEYNKHIADSILQSFSDKPLSNMTHNPYKFIEWNRTFVKIDPTKKEREMDKSISFDADF